jgi:3-oxoacyl-[acyl-carrier-protein] synthase III
MQPKSIAIVGAAETTRLGVIPDTSQIQLHADAALNAMTDAGLKPSDIDGIATAGETPVTVAHYLGLTMRLDADLLDWFRTNEGIKRG